MSGPVHSGLVVFDDRGRPVVYMPEDVTGWHGQFVDVRPIGREPRAVTAEDVRAADDAAHADKRHLTFSERFADALNALLGQGED